MKTNFKRFDTKNYEFNSNSEYGVYIIHGFSSSTYEIKQLAEFLGKKGFHAVANNLPGHGVTASDCNNIKYHDWFDAVKQDIAKLVSSSKKEVDSLLNLWHHHAAVSNLKGYMSLLRTMNY